jgi:hypothetical protein
MNCPSRFGLLMIAWSVELLHRTVCIVRTEMHDSSSVATASSQRPPRSTGVHLLDNSSMHKRPRRRLLLEDARAEDSSRSPTACHDCVGLECMETTGGFWTGELACQTTLVHLEYSHQWCSCALGSESDGQELVLARLVPRRAVASKAGASSSAASAAASAAAEGRARPASQTG